MSAPAVEAFAPAGPGAPVAGGSMMVKKTDKKVKVMSRTRCIYVDCKRREYVKVKGAYVRLSDARAK